MKNIKTLFATPKKAILSSCCIIGCLALLGTGTVFAGAVAGKKPIGKAAAQSIALKNVGITAEQAKQGRTKIDFENGELVYDVEFTANGMEYEYLLRASDGAVISKENKKVQQKSATVSKTDATSAAQKVTVQQAKDAALKDAGIASANATFTKAQLDIDDGIAVYDIEFYTAGTEYDYEINASTGAVYSKDKETHHNSATVNKADAATPAAQKITAQQAKDAALKDAGVASANATFTKAQLDTDDGITVYDIEFYTAGTEYDYEINASTGAVYSKEKEAKIQKIVKPQSTNKEYIGVDAAKAAALKHANLASSKVSFIKAKLENDDGCFQYEIEFYSGNNEYEYAIDAVTGAIIDYDVERINH